MTAADCALACSLLGLVAVGIALAKAESAQRMAQEADRRAKTTHQHAEETRCKAPSEPTREERIAGCRGHLDACKAAELTLGDLDDLPARILLANARSNAARARQELQALGVEP